MKRIKEVLRKANISLKDQRNRLIETEETCLVLDQKQQTGNRGQLVDVKILSNTPPQF